MDNVQLEFEPEALNEVAKLTIKRNTGARGLRAILEDVMLPVMYETPSRTDVEKVVITLPSVRKEEPPKYIFRSEKPENRIA